MSFDPSAAIIIVIVFLMFNAVINIYYDNNTGTIREYRVSNRKFSTISIIISIATSSFSGGTFYFILLYTLNHRIWPVALFACILSLFVQSYVIVPNMHRFLGKLSIAEAIGSLYGQHIRIITAVVSIIFSLTAAATEIKIILIFCSHNIFDAVFITALLTIGYLSFFGIRAVLITNVLHCFVFCTIIPLCLLSLWLQSNNLYLISDVLAYGVNIFNYDYLTGHKYYYPLIYYALPVLNPIVFHRVLVLSSICQYTYWIKSLSFIVLAIVIFLSIVITVLISNVDTSLYNVNIIPYISHIYLSNQYINLVLISITTMAISTTSLFIYTSSVIFFHDLCKSTDMFKNYNSRQESQIIRLFSIVFIIISLMISMLYDRLLLDLYILGEHFYSAIIGAPLLIMAFGLSNSSTVILASIVTWAFTTITMCCYNQSFIGISSIFIATIVSLIAAQITSYMLLKRDRNNMHMVEFKASHKKDKSNKVAASISLFSNYAQWDAIQNYCTRLNTLKHQRYYFYSSLFTILSLTTMAMLSTTVNPLSDFKLVFMLLIISFVAATTFITRHSLPFMNDSKYIGVLWHIFIFHSLIVTNTTLLVISGFDHVALVCFLLNLLVVAILIKWIVALIMIISGMSVAILILLAFQPDLMAYLMIDTRSAVSLIIVIVMVIIVLFFFIKTEQDEYVLESNMRNKAESKVKDINSLLDIKKNILNNLSHEVRAPLHGVKAGINLLTDYLHQYPECNQELLQMVSLANNSVERLCNYIDNLLDLSKFEANKMVFNIQLCDLNVLLDEIIVDFNILHVSKHHHIKIQHYIQKDIKLYCDHNRIKQVMFNLISNAIKYSKEGIITITASENQDKIYVSVEDQGDGIPGDELESIFQPFIQSRRNQSKIGSTGLGLNLCREIVAYHNGKIWAENRKEGGARFTFFIPIIKASQLPIGSDAKSHNATLAKNVYDIPTKILFVDDDQGALDSVRLFTYNTKYQVTTVTNGTEAVDLIISNPTQYDVIMLDISLPDKNAIMILQEVRPILNQYKTPVIIQSGYYGDEGLKKEFTSLGVKDFITKPYSQSTFLHCVVSVLTKEAKIDKKL